MRARFVGLKAARALGLAAAGLLAWPVPGWAQYLWSPWVPSFHLVSITNHIITGRVWVDVQVTLPDTCERVGDWGTTTLTTPAITANSACWYNPAGPCAYVVTRVSHSYPLGYLAPGNYRFLFQSWGQPVATNSFTVPATDSDGDGMSDYDEWIAGTNPSDRGSALRMVDFQVTGSEARISWQGGTNVAQYVERRARLNGSDTGWVCVLTNHPPTATTNVFVDPLGADGARFYRIRVKP
jgi:hypothetical protein